MGEYIEAFRMGEKVLVMGDIWNECTGFGVPGVHGNGECPIDIVYAARSITVNLMLHGLKSLYMSGNILCMTAGM